MACFHPLKGYRAKHLTRKGLRPIVFDRSQGFVDLPVVVPCGQCIGCRLERSRIWALRCHHESKLWDENCFITLTYDDDNLPDLGSLVKSDFQKFMKRFRQYLVRNGDLRKLRLFYCGEYGEKFGRPHFHAIIFNYDFADRELYRVTPAGEKLYTSELLSNVWQKGNCTVGDVSFKSAAYCARYVVQKVTGPESYAAYTRIDESGVTRKIVPPYNNSSRASGIGRGWYDRFRSDAYPSDFVVVDGVKMRPPRAYDCYYEIDDPNGFRRLKNNRRRRASKHAYNNTPERLTVREEVQLLRLERLKRELK